MPPLTFLGPVGTGDTYEAKDGFKKTGFSDTSFLLAGGGTALVSNFAIAANYYTKTQLQTSGQALVNWGNLTGIPTGLVSNSHTHSNKTFLDTVIPNTLVTNLNADLLDGKHATDFINRSEELGNRNLFLNSQKLLFSNSDQGNANSDVIEGDHVKITFTTTGNIYTYVKISTDLVVGETYTLSMEVLSEIASSVYFYVNGSYIISNMIPITTKWTRVYHTFIKTGTQINAGSNILFGFVNGIATKIIRYRNLKLERGSVDTGWIPAPEDQVADWNQTDVTAFDFIKNKPTSLPPTTHTHAISDVTGLQTALNGKYTLPTGGTTSQYINGLGNLATFPTIPQGTVTSVAMTTPTGLSVTGSPITSSGTLALSYATGYQGYTTAESTKLAGIAAGADNYGSWNLKTNGTQRIAVTSGGTLDLVAGTNVSLAYGAGGVVTINSTDTNNVYTAGTGIKLTTNVFGQDITTSGTGSFVTGISQTANGFQVNLGTPPNDNTVYTAGTGLSLNGTVFSHPTTAGNKHIPAGGVTGQILRWSADGTAVWGADNNTVYSIFTTNTPGLVPGRVGTTTTKYLREDGRWEIPPDNNSVYTNGTGLALSNNQFSLTTTVTTDIAKGVTAHGWGNHATVGYALKDGTNAIGTWATDSNGLFVNGTVGLKTFGPGGVNTSLNDATHGSVAGVINNPGTAVGNPNGDWHHRIKMLHNNPAGYFTEIAVSMAGVPKMHFKQFSNGTDYGWYEVVDVKNYQEITGLKLYKTQGTGLDAVNHFPLQAYAEGGASILPGVSFHKGGSHAGAIVLSPTTYEFRNQSGNGFLNILSLTSRAENGFIHDQYDDAEALLTSDGGVTYTGVDIVNSGGELRIQPLEITSSGNPINCAILKHKLVYIRVRNGNKIILNDPQPGQRFILFNVDGYGSEVEINSLIVGKLDAFTKISLYITNLGERLFYDKGEFYVGAF